MLLNEAQDGVEFPCAETEVARQGNRRQPEFGRQIVPVDVDVRWLVRLVAVEVDAIWPLAQDWGVIGSCPVPSLPDVRGALTCGYEVREQLGMRLGGRGRPPLPWRAWEGRRLACRRDVSRARSAAERPVARTGAEPGADWVVVNVLDETGSMFRSANQVVEGLPLPELPAAAQRRVDAVSGVRLPGVQEGGEGGAVEGGHQGVDVVGHDHPRPEPVPLTVEVTECTGDCPGSCAAGQPRVPATEWL